MLPGSSGLGADLSVQDRGYAIAASQVPRITERFYRVAKSRSRETVGPGLGLSIVKQVLDNHDATLEIEGAVGKGSTFTCHLKTNRGVPKTAQSEPQM